jgi:hypothetical protein
MNLNREPYRLLWTVFFAALLAGCETWPLRPQTDDGQALSDPPGPGLVASQSSKIADVPMPVGFLAVATRSNSYVPPSGPRAVTHTYQGIATVTDATRFYRQQLPSHGWQFVRERSDGSITTMVYVKGVEELSIQVSHPRVLDIVVMIRDRNGAGSAVKP